MKIAIRVVVLLALTWLAFVVFTELGRYWRMKPDDPGYDPTQVVIYFLIIVAIGIAVGGLVAFTLLPELAERIGHFFYNPNQEIEKNPHAEALALMHQGDYEAAAEAYRKIVEDDPSDMHALSEAVRLQCEKLGDFDQAAAYLESFLEDERPADDTAFLAERLVDVYWVHQKNPELALAVLRQIQESMPETKHAANAFHRIREIEDAMGFAHGTLTDAAADPPAEDGQSPDTAAEENQPADSPDESGEPAPEKA